MNHLLHPELFDLLPVGGDRLASHINGMATERASVVAADTTTEQPLSVVVRTLNEAAPLRSFLQDIGRQGLKMPIDLVVVDNESSDGTLEVAREADARIVTVPREQFTHPYSLNLGVQAARHEAVFVASSHILLATDQALPAGLAHLRAGAAGAYAWPPIPNAGASGIERAGIGALSHRLLGDARPLPQVRWGAMSMAGAMIRRSAWEYHGGFDESFQSGGEDTELARRMIAANNDIVFDGAMAIHHTHGMTISGRLKRTFTLGKAVLGFGGTEFDRQKMNKQRPSLDLNN